MWIGQRLIVLFKGIYLKRAVKGTLVGVVEDTRVDG